MYTPGNRPPTRATHNPLIYLDSPASTRLGIRIAVSRHDETLLNIKGAIT